MGHRFSVSQISLYNRCGISYYYRYVEKIPSVVTNHNLIIGSIVHMLLEQGLIMKNTVPVETILLADFDKISEQIFNSIHLPDPDNLEDWQEPGLKYPDPHWPVGVIKDGKIKSAKDVETQLVNFGFHVLIERMENQPGWTDQEIVEGIQAVAGLLNTYFYSQQFQDTITDENNVEVALEFTIDNHEFIGYIDVVDLARERPVLIDLKTAKRKYQDIKLIQDIQLLTYAYAYHQLYDVWPDIEYQVIIKGKKNADVQVLHMDAEQVRKEWYKIEQRIISVLRGIEAGVFIPAEPGHWLCSPKWCPYYDKCPYVQQDETEVPDEDI